MSLSERVIDIIKRDRPHEFTLEFGRGQTYVNEQPTLYAHGEYGRSSVLAGQNKRIFVESFENMDEAVLVLHPILAAQPKFKRLLRDLTTDNGTTFVPPSLSHLPNDADY